MASTPRIDDAALPGFTHVGEGVIANGDRIGPCLPVEPSMRKDASAFLPLPDLSVHVLLALADGARHGWSIIKRISEMTEGRREPSSGSLYLSMIRLEQRGLIQTAASPASETDARRRYYRLTSLGRRVLEAELRRMSGLIGAARLSGITVDRATRSLEAG
jgi:DNA-binding PadR family transcriptional regulator